MLDIPTPAHAFEDYYIDGKHGWTLADIGHQPSLTDPDEADCDFLGVSLGGLIDVTSQMLARRYEDPHILRVQDPNLPEVAAILEINAGLRLAQEGLEKLLANKSRSA